MTTLKDRIAKVIKHHMEHELESALSVSRDGLINETAVAIVNEGQGIH